MKTLNTKTVNNAKSGGPSKPQQNPSEPKKASRFDDDEEDDFDIAMDDDLGSFNDIDLDDDDF